ncbi:MAG: META domain-containing protein [Anaerolineales bacterium]|nr:MAG: META domain-containing protein [Anaerolineales bacterium]
MKRSSVILVSVGIILLIILVGCASTGDKPGASNGTIDILDGTNWNLDTYQESSLMEGTSFTISFTAGQVHGNAGCNSFFGSYTLNGSQIAFSALGMTEMACLEPEGLMDQEQALLAFLGDGQSFDISAGRFSIFRTDGEALLFNPLP